MIAGCCFGTISTFSALLRDNGISSFQQSFSRAFFALLFILLIFMYRRMNFLISVKELPHYIALGMVMAGLGFLENSAVAVGAPVAVVVLFLYTQPVWTAILGKTFFQERLTLFRKCGVAMALFGIFLISKIWNISSFHYIGGGIALVAGVLLSIEFVMIKTLSLKPRHFLVSIFWFYIFRTLFTIVFGVGSRLVTGNILITGITFSLSVEMWGLLFLFALIPMVFGMILFYRSIKYVPIVLTGVIMMMEPISGVLYGYVILGEFVDLYTITGGIFILAASLLVVSEKDSAKSEILKESNIQQHD